MGVTPVCFTAKDSCGQTKSCCFNVTIQEDDPCDTKVIGCMKYELLTITEDPGKNRTYRIRVTNNCSNKLIYTAIQVPDGMVAIEPANFSTYTAPSGNNYLVRSPNFSPQYSIRYSSVSDSINNGESDIFKYTLPAQANVTYIHVVSRLAPYIYLGAHLNTFYCPIGITQSENRHEEDCMRVGLDNTGSSARRCLSLWLVVFAAQAFVQVVILTSNFTSDIKVQACELSPRPLELPVKNELARPAIIRMVFFMEAPMR